MVIKGQFRRTIFGGASGYLVGLFKIKEVDDINYINKTITFTGYFDNLNDRDTYIFNGEFVHHDKFGNQFNVSSYEKVLPTDKDSIVEFLSSGMFKGIGEAKAHKIVNIMGKTTLDAILNNPDSLILIPGITKQNINELYMGLKKYQDSYQTLIYLGDLGLSPKDSIGVYNIYKDKTEEIVKNNPYKLINNEITFKQIDYIVMNKFQIEQSDKRRIKACIIYTFNELINMVCHSYFMIEEIYNYTNKILMMTIDKELFVVCINDLIEDKEIIKIEEKLYLRAIYDAERNIVSRVNYLNNIEIKDKEYKKDEMACTAQIEVLEKVFNIKYNSLQTKAIIKGVLNKFLIITGGPGTGKTTIIKSIVELYKSLHNLDYENLIKEIALLAPTGRAAKRISESTGLLASTIHRFLKWNKDNNTFSVNENNKSEVKFVIIDESSMIDVYLFDSLLKGISVNAKIILVGDSDQIPSVGPGQVLKDLIESDILDVVKLKHLYRQGSDSNIISLAHMINDDNLDLDVFKGNDDLEFIPANSNDLKEKLVELTNKLENLTFRDFQVMAPIYKTDGGIDDLNNLYQSIFNKKSRGKIDLMVGEVVYREEDKVIQLVNMPNENVYNGDIGLIESIELKPRKIITINFEGNVVKYTPSSFNKFKHAYSISIHKSQGSEFDVVILPILKSYNRMLYRKLYYTAVSRAKKKLIIIGEIEALNMAIKNNNNDIRRTTIKEMLTSKNK
ncbi:MAG: ATP-dependent RecD-like DNA helicase [Bacilli bacterium]